MDTGGLCENDLGKHPRRMVLRQGDYKYVYSEQRLQGTLGVWAEPFTTLRLQKIFNLMQDP